MWISSASRCALASLEHAPLVEQPNAEHGAPRLAAEEQVAGDVDRVAQRQVLIDHLDPPAPGLGRRGEGDGGAVELDPAGIGHVGPGDDLGQRRLAGGIVADQPEHLAGEQVEIDAAQRLDGAEALPDAR